MILDIFEDNTVCVNDSVQGSHPVTYGTSLSFTCDKGVKHLKITILGNCLDRFSSVMCDPYSKSRQHKRVCDTQVIWQYYWQFYVKLQE